MKKVKSEAEITWKDIETGAIVDEPGNATQYETGTWRSKKPIFNFTKCNKCGLCALFCPEGCIAQNKEGYYDADLYYCKGCGICAAECRPGAITMVEEGE